MTKLSETLPIEEARERLRQLISELAVVRGKVTLASGKEADYYVDLRRITLHHEASRLVGQVMLDLLDRNGIEFEAAGGLTMGADPVGSAIMRARAIRTALSIRLWCVRRKSPTAWVARLRGLALRVAAWSPLKILPPLEGLR